MVFDPVDLCVGSATLSKCIVTITYAIFAVRQLSRKRRGTGEGQTNPEGGQRVSRGSAWRDQGRGKGKGTPQTQSCKAKDARINEMQNPARQAGGEGEVEVEWIC